MAIYKFKRKRHVCSMKGCRNKEVLLCTKNGELGGGIYLCGECIEELYKNSKLFDVGKAVSAGSDTTAKNEVKAEAGIKTSSIAESDRAKGGSRKKDVAK